ncbi:MAG TPA: tyrosine--tRNA ligase [Patescibacteria group bacterium]|nr:tyrosine--tRNA ligase [Patescibacteria group bacterium]
MNNTTEEVLTRGVEQVLPTKEGLANLMGKKKIRVYLGIDPTGNQLHLGHSVVLRKLQQFADLGHEVILLIGNGTVKIGDPTGKDKTRPMLTDELIEENFKTWKEQASKILDFSKITIKRNGDWLDKLTFVDLVKLMATTTVQQLMERDMFQERIKNSLPIFAHEIIYPLLQGYDSVVMDVDLEIGGNDQTFNMLMGRQLQKQMNNREKYVLSVPLLVGSDGRKMGKSLNNFISLTDTPENMYGKLMSVVDEVMMQYFTLLTNVPASEIEEMKQALSKKEVHPMDIKKKLAHVITTMYHSENAANDAAAYFEKTVQKKEITEEVASAIDGSQAKTMLDLVELSGVCASKGDARRLIEQGGVHVGDEKVTDPMAPFTAPSGTIVKIGKRNFFQVTRG